ncbi:cation:proton antiporter [Arcticibacter tournemirensis]|uniref:Sodium:proton antiporter n=1 Tax=Arcticibacter tournemirensis TaxID=699437 RepID=A0A4Q0M2H9_9SPHI|nr:cation:proton antiporter [Arcticibacter tournemirensis]RXF67068.1 sodium:proton antiporter [Arcticibacter tournemirensis]
MNVYIIELLIVGLAAFGMAWMPALAKKTRISYSIFYVLIGFLLYRTFDFFPTPDPLRKESYTLHLTEIMVIISLMGTGLKIDRPFSFRGWKIPFLLVSVTMMLCIGGVAAIAFYFLGFDLPSSILLGAVLAPTDPVLASDVQVGPPHEKEKNEVRFALTAEAGMNDGTAFPFTWLAIVVFMIQSGATPDLSEWLYKDLLYRIVIGIACGFIIARLVALLVFYLPKRKVFVEIRDGFVALSVTLIVYGITELVHGYGFIAVFVAAITLRNYEMHDKYHTSLHSFTDQIERILLGIILLLFGGSLATGVLDALTWPLALFGIAFLLLIRPIGGMLTLLPVNLSMKEKTAISFFGIRGIGSFFYLAFGLSKADFKYADELWATLCFVVLISVIVHGATAAFGMRMVESEHEEND